MRKFVYEMVGDCTMKTFFKIVHGLDTLNIVCNMRRSSDNANSIIGDVISLDLNTVTVNFREPLDDGEIVTITIFG
jgi:hypothetical protein